MAYFYIKIRALVITKYAYYKDDHCTYYYIGRGPDNYMLNIKNRIIVAIWTVVNCYTLLLLLYIMYNV